MNAIACHSISAAELCGLPTGISATDTFPQSGRGVRLHLKRFGYPTVSVPSNGGEAVAVRWEDLRPETQVAYLQRAHGVTQDDGPDQTLWSEFGRKSLTVQEGAKRALFALAAFDEKVSQGRSNKAATDEVCEETGFSPAYIYKIRAKVRDVARANWLPVLAANYTGGRPRTEMSEEAWTYCLSVLQEGSKRLPLSKAYRKTAEAAAVFDWDWPCYGTVRNRWEELPAGEKALIKSGDKALDKTIPPMKRSVAHLQAMQIINLDGRQTDYFVRWKDGTSSRAIVIALQDVYSRYILDWRFAKTEDADTTKAVILDVIDRFGLFDELRTDNGRAFASKKISGGAKTRFRGRNKGDDEELGIITLIGAKIGFAKPRRGQSKPIERGFRDVAEQIDTLPEFKGAYCGHRPDAKPEEFTGTPVDIDVAEAVYQRELRTHNEQVGRRTEMAKGKLSFTQVFEESYKQRPRRDLTQAQRAFFMFDMAYLKPQKDTGALSKDGFTWWSREHQDALLKHRNGKLCVLFDPNDRSKPVIVHDAQGNVIVESLPCLKVGKFDSTEDARQHERGKAQIKAAAKRELKGRKLMVGAQLANIQKRVDDARPDPVPPVSQTNISKPLFGTPGMKAKPVAPDTSACPTPAALAFGPAWPHRARSN
ncbi:transposase domain-containing protein [Magnetospirillum sp. 15-1]|uniref:transposase domain-containing protein n=1 Tax=Magnetospirillum sp. 15-1 TaxID=1979370 RepID=UPI000BBB9248|nr:transposase domain-containing protein [Magnetospirillum sp. 15-1]